jgi:hypothetical protein
VKICFKGLQYTAIQEWVQQLHFFQEKSAFFSNVTSKSKFVNHHALSTKNGISLGESRIREVNIASKNSFIILNKIGKYCRIYNNIKHLFYILMFLIYLIQLL